MSDDLTKILQETPDQLDDVDVIGGLTGPAKVDPESPTVLDLDRWSMHQGKRIAESWQESDIIDWQSPDANPGCDPNMLVSDAHGVLFEPSPQMAKRPIEKARAAWFKQLMESPEFKSLHNQTVLQSEMASIAAKRICDQWMEYVASCDGDPEPGEGEPSPGSDDESIEDSLKRMRSTADALKDAKEDVDTAEDMMAGLGMGSEGKPLDPKELSEYFHKVQNNNLLRQILAMAGRMRRLCQSLQKYKVHAKRGEISGIELGGDISKLIPQELLAVTGAVPELQDQALYRLLRRRCLCWKHKKNEPKQSGPIVVVVDESGSMHGDKIVQAKGLAMALSWLAKHQKRWLALVGFSGGEEGNVLTIPPNEGGDDQLIDWLLHMYGGGTTLDVPIKQLPFSYWPAFIEQGMPRGKTDVILITDAIVHAPDDMIGDYKFWAESEQVRTYGIIVGGDEPGDLERICTRNWCVSELDLESDAVEGVLSI